MKHTVISSCLNVHKIVKLYEESVVKDCLCKYWERDNYGNIWCNFNMCINYSEFGESSMDILVDGRATRNRLGIWNKYGDDGVVALGVGILVCTSDYRSIDICNIVLCSEDKESLFESRTA